MARRRARSLPAKQWTMLAYIAGDNNLSDNGLDDIQEMCDMGASRAAHVGVQIDTKGEHDGAIRYEITPPDPTGVAHRVVIERLPEPDSGNPEVLYEFLQWGLRRYPARRRLVVVWNHGAGFRTARRDIAFDDYGTSLDMTELQRALRRAGLGPRNKLAILGFDACLIEHGSRSSISCATRRSSSWGRSKPSPAMAGPTIGAEGHEERSVRGADGAADRAPVHESLSGRGGRQRDPERRALRGASRRRCGRGARWAMRWRPRLPRRGPPFAGRARWCRRTSTRTTSMRCMRRRLFARLTKSAAGTLGPGRARAFESAVSARCVVAAGVSTAAPRCANPTDSPLAPARTRRQDLELRGCAVTLLCDFPAAVYSGSHLGTILGVAAGRRAARGTRSRSLARRLALRRHRQLRAGLPGRGCRGRRGRATS